MAKMTTRHRYRIEPDETTILNVYTDSSASAAAMKRLYVKNRLTLVEQERLDATRMLAAVEGAIQACEFDIQELNKQDPAPGEEISPGANGKAPEAIPEGDDNGNS